MPDFNEDFESVFSQRSISNFVDSIENQIDEFDDHHADICRVCRSEGTSEKPLYYPCLCTGSIKFVHQECLMQWLKYSKKEFCELCNHRYSFQPIYRWDMPKRLPLGDMIRGVVRKTCLLVRTWCLYTVVVTAWLGLVPLTACRIYKAIFAGSMSSLLMLPLDLISLEHVVIDCLHGCFIVSIFLCTFISLVWLRDQIIHGGPQHWINLDGDPVQPVNNQNGQPPVGVVEHEHEHEDDEQGDNAMMDDDDDGEEVEEREEGDEEEQQVPQHEEEEEAGNAANEANNWPEFDRVGEDLTWERLLGLDGSFAFLEHVFWVISLNTFFTVVFAFSPYQVGNVALSFLDWHSYMSVTRFSGILTALLGYLIICTVVLIVHKVMKLFRIKSAHRATGMSYLILKVFLLVLVEIGLFPLLCGWWLDICSLPLFSSSLHSRMGSFEASPGTSTFVHWLVGMAYVFYFASFVLALREVLRPGVLWFLRNLNDPEFNPIQEMIQLPVLKHLRRLVSSISLFSLTIMLVVYCPIRIMQKLFPSMLPYNISLTAETPLSELSLELLLLQVILPALLEQSHARSALKSLVKIWCSSVGNFLDLTEYLLPAEAVNMTRGMFADYLWELSNNRHSTINTQIHRAFVAALNFALQLNPTPAAVPNPDVGAQGLAAEHQALLLAREPAGFQSYSRSTCWFPARIAALLGLLSVTTVVFSCLCFVVPVAVGRATVYLCTGHLRVHELYTVGTGLYVTFMFFKLALLIHEWFPRGWRVVADGFEQWLISGAKLTIACIAIVGVIPLLLGVTFQLVVITPMRVSQHQSSLFFPWQLYQDGLRNLNLTYLYLELVLPVCVYFGLIITVPYALSTLSVQFLGATMEERVLFTRFCYPSLLLFLSCLLFIFWQYEKAKGLAQKIRNDKYLVGTQLVNYEKNLLKVS